MASLYDELLAQLGKQASSSETVKQSIADLDTDEIMVLANELATLTNDPELAAMAKVLPVYASGGNVDNQIAVEQAISNVKPGELPVINEESEPLVSGPGGEGDATDVVASDETARQEKIAEDPEETEENKKKEDDSEKKEVPADKDKDKGEGEEEEVTATEVLYQILKEGAALEEMIEVRASEMLEDWVKLAEDYEVAREVVDATAAQLSGGNAIKAHEYSEQMMDKVKTVAAAKDVPMSEAAQAVSGEVLNLAKKVASTQYNSYGSDLNKLAEYSLALEDEYEKVAEQIGETAEAIIREMGMKQGLTDPKLFEFVQRSMDTVKTHAAKNNINLAQAAQAFVAGATGSGVGYVEPIIPSPSQAPSPVKQPINSNQTQDPDKFVPQMVAGADPQALEAAKEAEVKDYIKAMLKEAMLKGLQLK
jgi:hypothetical protein